MNENEFTKYLTKAQIKIDDKFTIYGVGCQECVTYSVTNNNIGITVKAIATGLMDGKEEEFKTAQAAQEAIKLHKAKNPLHEPYINAPVMEYLTHTQKHMIRYRIVDYRYGIHVYSINGYRIALDKCGYECKLCGAIYECLITHPLSEVYSEMARMEQRNQARRNYLATMKMEREGGYFSLLQR